MDEDELVRRIRQKCKERMAKEAAFKAMVVEFAEEMRGDMDREMGNALDEVLAVYSDHTWYLDDLEVS